MMSAPELIDACLQRAGEERANAPAPEANASAIGQLLNRAVLTFVQPYNVGANNRRVPLVHLRANTLHSIMPPLCELTLEGHGWLLLTLSPDGTLLSGVLSRTDVQRQPRLERFTYDLTPETAHAIVTALIVRWLSTPKRKRGQQRP